MNLFIYYISFAIGTLAASAFLYSMVIFSQSLDAIKGFSGIVFFFLFLPFPLFFLFTGTLLDRYSKKWILIAFQSIHLLVALILYLFSEIFTLHSQWLLLMAFANGIGMSTVLPGRMAILKDLAESHRVVFHTILGNLLVIVCFGLSPLFVGAIKESKTFQDVFLVIAVMHFVSISIAIFLTVKKQDSKFQNFSIRDVLHFLQKDTVSRQVLYVTVLSMLALGPIQVLLPKYLKDTLSLGELARGTTLVAFGPGLFVGGILTILFHHKERKGLILLSVLFVSTFFFLGLVPFSNGWITSIFLFAFGITGGIISSLLPALLQKRSDDHIRGRLLSLYTVCFQFTPAVSGLGSAYLGDSIGIMNAFFTMGIFFVILSMIGFFLYSDLRKS
jgi:MFS family permease